MNYYVITEERKRNARTGMMPVALLFKHNGKRFTVNTGLTASVKVKDMAFGKNEKDARAKTRRLARIMEDVDAFLEGADMHDWERMKAGVRAVVTGEKPKRALRLWECIMDYAAGAGKDSTRQIYELTARKVAAYDRAATYDSVDCAWLDGFVRSMRGASVNHVSIQLRNIRAVFNRAIRDEVTDRYPFRRYKIRSERTEIRNISAEELREIRDCRVPHWMEIYRDLFMLSFYLCGMNPIDMLHLRHGDVRGGRLRYRRAKTGHVFDLPVTDEAAAIMKRYEGKDWLLCPMDSVRDYKNFAMRWNRALKRIGPVTVGANATGKMCRREFHPICPDLTVYSARYTFASIGAQLDIPRETIALCLGHEWADVTSRYISYDTRKIDGAVRKITDFLSAGN